MVQPCQHFFCGDCHNNRLLNNNGCSASSLATNVIVNTLPTPIITPSSLTTFCQGDSVILTANTANSYLWSNSATTQSITVSTSGNYSVLVTDNNGCSAYSSATSSRVLTFSGNDSINGSSFCILK